MLSFIQKPFIINIHPPPSSHQPPLCTQKKPIPNKLTRRSYLIRQAALLTTTFLLPNILHRTPQPLHAEDIPQLPKGALQLNRLLAAQARWKEIGEALTKRGDEFKEDEWDSLQSYLRKFYAVGDDMQVLGKTMDGERREMVGKVVKDFRKSVKGMDKPARKRDLKEFEREYGVTRDLMNSFFEIFKGSLASNVPDEL